MESATTARQSESFDDSLDAGEINGGSGNDGRSGRLHKGGRKLIYATVEERKERNRQAQATFRERRIVYVAQLERTIQEQRDQLRRLQDACSSATDERLNLKYKNSLLERILLEKGIEVRAELDAETPLQSKTTSKVRHRSTRRSKSTAVCRRHSSMTSEPTEMFETCRCNASTCHSKDSSNIPDAVNHSSQYVAQKTLSVPSDLTRWQPTHARQTVGKSTTHDGMPLSNNTTHLGPGTQYHNPHIRRHDADCTSDSPNSTPILSSQAILYDSQNHLKHLELEWSTILPPDGAASPAALADDDGSQEHYGVLDNVTSTTHRSSPISPVRTPPDFNAAVAHINQYQHQQQQQQQSRFAKQVDGVDPLCFDFDHATGGRGDLAYETGLELVQDPFGLDASLFSI